MEKTMKIQFRVTEKEYTGLKRQADIFNIKISELARLRTLNNSSLSPRVFCTIASLYNQFDIPADKWNKEMERNYKEGMKYLYDVLQNRQ